MYVDVRKKPVNIVFVGHVDVGKSTICGNSLKANNFCWNERLTFL